MERMIAILFAFLGLALVTKMSCDAREQSAKRIEREHGIQLPAGASNFRCGGNAWRGFLDRVSESTFEADEIWIPGFIAQLTVDRRHTDKRPATNQYHHLPGPWDRPGTGPSIDLQCKSTTGDSLDVEVWPMGKGRVVIWVYTDWN